MEDANESKKIRIIDFQFDLYPEAPLNRNPFMNLMWPHVMVFEFQYYCWPTHNYRIYWEMILSSRGVQVCPYPLSPPVPACIFPV